MAKNYIQKEGFDYESVAMIKSIRILLSIVAYMDYKILQMDVKTTFLNGSLDETIYMVQLEGFIAKGQKNKVCKLQKSIYSLSRHQGLGTSNLTNRSKYLDLSNVLMSLVCTREAADTWWCFSYFM